MTREELEEYSEAAQNRPMSNLKDVDGFKRILDLGWEKSLISTAEHDQIWFSVDVDWFITVATKDDVDYLSDCGIWYSDEYDSFSMFA